MSDQSSSRPARRPLVESKAILLGLMRRPEGMSQAEGSEALGWKRCDGTIAELCAEVQANGLLLRRWKAEDGKSRFAVTDAPKPAKTAKAAAKPVTVAEAAPKAKAPAKAEASAVADAKAAKPARRQAQTGKEAVKVAKPVAKKAAAKKPAAAAQAAQA